MNINKKIIIVGAGLAGLCCAIEAKYNNKELEIIIIDKEKSAGNHNLSGAIIEIKYLKQLLDKVKPNWKKDEYFNKLTFAKINKENICFLTKHLKINIMSIISIAEKLNLNIGRLQNKDNYIISVSEVIKFLTYIAQELEVSIITGFGVENIIYENKIPKAIKLVDQGKNRDNTKQPNFLEGETICFDYLVLAEGAKGLLTEKLVKDSILRRELPQTYSIGLKEIYEIDKKTYKSFGENSVLHTIGYPLWAPILGPDIFGGGFIYSYGENKLTLGIIISTDWKYYDFNPQNALILFKKNKFVNQLIENGKLIENGAKLIPEGGYYSIPRNAHNHIGDKNIVIIGDSAGFIDMTKIKGIHLGILSGILAAQSLMNLQRTVDFAEIYTIAIENSQIIKDLKSAKNYRQIISKLGSTIGFPLSICSQLFSKIKIREDYKNMKLRKYKYNIDKKFDKMQFVSLTNTSHRESQPIHLKIINPEICIKKCLKKYNCPCLIFCPAGVYEKINDKILPLNPSNCIHCKTCEQKCPYNNITWNMPEGGGGPQYEHM